MLSCLLLRLSAPGSASDAVEWSALVHTADTKLGDTVWASLRSTSLNVSVPPTLSLVDEPVGLGGVAFASSLNAPLAAAAVLVNVGVSLVPVIVTVTAWTA